MKVPLGLWEGSTENATVATALLSDLVERGLDPEQGMLFVLDGSKALRKAVRSVFGEVPVQRCLWHKERNVLGHLPERDRPQVKTRMRRAWRETDYPRALEQLQRLADELEHTHPGAAGSLREGMAETLTVIRLGIKGKLRRTLESTNAAESMIDTVRRTQRNVKRWSSGEMGLRWTAAGMLEAEKQFRKVIGYTDLPRLAVAIERQLHLHQPNPVTDPGGRHRSHCVTITPGPSSPKFHDDRDNLPLASVFDLPGASTDWGWNIDRVTRLGLFVGSVGAKPLVFTQSRIVVDLSRAMIAGFRISDGALVWRDPGVTYMCNELPCQGSVQAGYNSASTVDSGGPSVGVGLSATGTETAVPNSGPSATTVSAGAQATLEGFDPATGRILWRFAAGRNPGLLTSHIFPPQVGASTIVLKMPGKLVALNLATGSQQQTTATAPAWCRNLVEYHEQIPYRADGISSKIYIGQFGLYPCTSAQKPLATPKPIPAFVSAIGAHADGLVAWAENTGVIATRP